MKNKALAIRISVKFALAILFCCYSLFQQNAVAQSELDYKTIQEANKAYSSGDFQKAAELYENVLKKGFTSAELNYNLGNTYYRLNDYKRAILHYERAKLLKPDDENISINLEFAQKFVQDKIESVPKFILVRWGNEFVDVFTAQTWSLLSIITFILFLILLIFFLFSQRTTLRKLSVYVGFFSILISAICYFCAFRQSQKVTSHSTAIVFSPAVTVKSSPDKNGTELFIIHEGLKVTILSESGSWKEIKLSDGKIGWLPKETIEEI